MATRWEITKAVRASSLRAPSRLVMDLPHIKPGWTVDLRRFESTGLVYYLCRSDGAVKIGCTRNYPQRRQTLVHHHGPLRLVAWEFGYYGIEHQRHEQFGHLRLDPVAEWFRVEDDLYDHILYLLALSA